VQVLHLTGIVEDGSRRSSTIPADMRKVVHATRGASLSIFVQVLLPSGAAPDQAGATLVLSVQRVPWPNAPAIQVAGVLQPDGTYLCAITPAMTRDLAVGRYLYDVWYLQGADRNQVVPVSAFFIAPTVTPVP